MTGLIDAGRDVCHGAHVPDTAGVGYCVRCDAPSGAPARLGYEPEEHAPDEWLPAGPFNGGRTRCLPTPTALDDDPDPWEPSGL